MPAALFPELGERTDLALGIAVLARQHGIFLGKGEERISIGSAPQPVAEALRLSTGAPILKLDRLLHNLDGQAVEWRIGMCHFSGEYYLADIH